MKFFIKRFKLIFQLLLIDKFTFLALTIDSLAGFDLESFLINFAKYYDSCSYRYTYQIYRRQLAIFSLQHKVAAVRAEASHRQLV